MVHLTLQALRPEFGTTSWAAFSEHVLSGRPAGQVAAAPGVRVGTIHAAKLGISSRLRRELEGLLED
jgi:hypothetical protein